LDVSAIDIDSYSRLQLPRYLLLSDAKYNKTHRPVHKVVGARRYQSEPIWLVSKLCADFTTLSTQLPGRRNNPMRHNNMRRSLRDGFALACSPDYRNGKDAARRNSV